jgi:hypothetical protein
MLWTATSTHELHVQQRIDHAARGCRELALSKSAHTCSSYSCPCNYAASSISILTQPPNMQLPRTRFATEQALRRTARHAVALCALLPLCRLLLTQLVDADAQLYLRRQHTSQLFEAQRMPLCGCEVSTYIPTCQQMCCGAEARGSQTHHTGSSFVRLSSARACQKSSFWPSGAARSAAVSQTHTESTCASKKLSRPRSSASGPSS